MTKYHQYLLSIIIVLASCSLGFAGNDIRGFDFIKENYQSVSFEELKGKPDKYSGSQIRIDGYLGRDFDWVDTHGIPALYNKAFTKEKGPDPGTLKVGIDPFYATALKLFGFPKKCVIYGVYIASSHTGNSEGLFSFARIDYIVGGDGKVFKMFFSAEDGGSEAKKQK